MKKLIVSVGMALGCVASIFAAKSDDFSSYKKLVIEERRDMDAFENAEFEDTSKYGVSENGHVEIGRFGYNGNGGARIRPCPKQVYSFRLKVKPTLKLEKGKNYILSAYIRNRGKIGCQTCADVSFKTGKYAFGAWGPASEALSDGWVQHTVKFVPKYDYEDLNYYFMVYCRMPNDADFSSAENYVEVDNVAIHLAAPKWYCSNTWPTHNMIFSEKGRVRVHSAFFGDYVKKDADIVYAFCLKTAEGKVIGEKILKSDEKGNMTVEFGKLDYEGAATLSVTLYDRTNKLNLGTRQFELKVTPTPTITKGLFVQENGIVLKDGKPYMPIGFYTDLAYPKYSKEHVEEQLKRMHDAGFDAMIDYGTYAMNLERRDWYYDLCYKYGVNVLNDDYKATAELADLEKWLPKFREKAIRELKYPALIGYYTMDEGPESFVEPLSRLRRMLNEVSPHRIVNICNILRPFPYLPCADIQGGDAYPIKYGADMMGAYNYLQRMVDCAPAAIWYAPQAYNWASMVSGAKTNATLYAKSGREPKENEALSVALMMAAVGVRGFFFYSYFDIFRCPIKERIPERWRIAAAACKCLRDLEPFLMSGRKVIDVPHTDAKGQTLVRAFSNGKGEWRIIVVGLEKDHETTFKLPAKCGELKSRCGNITFENGVYTFRGKDFSCDVLQ